LTKWGHSENPFAVTTSQLSHRWNRPPSRAPDRAAGGLVQWWLTGANLADGTWLWDEFRMTDLIDDP
jgi:hypothetical protein